MSPASWHRRVAVVTGASRGIGWRVAEHFALQGYSLGLCARSTVDLEPEAARLASVNRVDVVVEALDVSETDDVEAFADLVHRDLGSPSVVVNNAAVLGPVGLVTEVDPRMWSRTMATNLLGVVNVTAAFGRAMIASGGGCIVNLAGGGAGGPAMAPRLSAYTTSKVAVVALSETVASELSDFGVRVNAIAPGAAATGFTKTILEAGPETAGEALFTSTTADAERPVDLERFFRLLDFVVSDEATWLTGRLLSARWDSPDRIRESRALLEASSLFQLRRIDGDLYVEPPRGND